MPTPPFQRIASPWSGQGSIATTYDLSVVNDRYASDGWVLLYNTFNATSTAKLHNPYFVLYNKFRGLLRIFTYMTTDFVSYSSHIKENISINSSKGLGKNMFNFLGETVIDPKNKHSTYKQIQPAPVDGSAPFASNKWYMSEFEIAYDPSVNNIPYYDIQLAWGLEYHNITRIDFSGNIHGTINAATGGKSKEKQFVSDLEKNGKVAGAAIISGIGANFLNNKATNRETGENTLGIPKDIYKSILKGATSAISSNVGKLPETALGLFSAILGGSSKSTAINLTADLDVTLEGTSTNTGSFPSSPTSVWVPGTNITSSASGFIPLYNKPLGVFNIIKKLPPVKVSGTDYLYTNGSYFRTHMKLTVPPRINLTRYIEFNPEVKKEARVSIQKQELILRLSDEFQFNGSSEVRDVLCAREDKWMGVTKSVSPSLKGKSVNCYVNPMSIYLYIDQTLSTDKPYYDFIYRVTIEVRPLNGSPVSTIVKTFKLDTDQTDLDIQTIYVR